MMMELAMASQHLRYLKHENTGSLSLEIDVRSCTMTPKIKSFLPKCKYRKTKS